MNKNIDTGFPKPCVGGSNPPKRTTILSALLRPLESAFSLLVHHLVQYKMFHVKHDIKETLI